MHPKSVSDLELDDEKLEHVKSCSLVEKDDARSI